MSAPRRPRCVQKAALTWTQSCGLRERPSESLPLTSLAGLLPRRCASVAEIWLFVVGVHTAEAPKPESPYWLSRFGVNAFQVDHGLRCRRISP